MARNKGTAGFVIGEETAIEVDGDYMRFFQAGMLMGCFRVTPGSAAALRALADRCERIASLPVATVARDLFEGL